MKTFLGASRLGVLVLGENQELLEARKIKEGENILETLEKVARAHEKKGATVHSEIEVPGTVHEFPNPAGKKLRKEGPQLFGYEQEEARLLERERAIREATQKIRENQGLDHHLSQAVELLEEIDRIINTLANRLREWYHGYNPEEASSLDNTQLAEKVASVPAARPRDTLGGEARQEDLEEMRSLALLVKILEEERERKKRYIEELSRLLMPRASEIAGPMLAARMLAHAGSLEKLARMPSSTIQVLGAEKALFRHLRGKGSPPKHGLLFYHPEVSGAPKKERGKKARKLASKLAIAFRQDYYSRGNK